MTDREFWSALGAELAKYRRDRGYPAARDFMRKFGTPNERTVEAIDEGRPGNASSINDYCEKLKVSLVDVIRAVLPDAKYSAAAQSVARDFDGAHPATRKAVLAVLAIPREEPATPPRAGDGPGAATPARTERVSGKRPR